MAKSAHEFACPAQLCEIAANLDLRTRQGKLSFSHFDGHAGQIIGQPVRRGKSKNGFADDFHQRFRLEIAVAADTFRQALHAKQFVLRRCALP